MPGSVFWIAGQLAGGVLFLFEDFDFYGDDAAIYESELFGGSDGDVDDAAFFEGATIVDDDYFGLFIGEIGYPDLGAHGEGFVGGCGGVVGEGFTAGGFCAVVGFDGIPRGFAMLGGGYLVVFIYVALCSGCVGV